MKHTVFAVVGCFTVGALVGSLAPFLATLGSNSFLLNLIVETWRRYLFVEGWWPWPIAVGTLFSFAYLASVRLRR